MLWLAWIGCGKVPLDEVEIDGGTPELRDTIRRLLAAFDEAAGPGRTELHAIRIRPTSRFGGRYNPVDRTLTLAESAYPLSDILRHELCHALFDQEDLGRALRRAEAHPIDELVELVFDPDAPRGPPDLPLPTPSRRRSESVATICAQGPYWAADVQRGVCPRFESIETDPELTDGVARWLMAHVWTDFALPEPMPFDPIDAIRTAPGVLYDTPARISPTDDPRVIALAYRDGPTRYVDLYDGTPVVSDLPPLDGDPRLPVGLGIWTSPGGAAGWPEGPAAVSGTWLPRPLGGHFARLLVHDGEAWRFLGDGCEEATHLMFTADDQLWTAWRDGYALTWARIGER